MMKPPPPFVRPVKPRLITDDLLFTHRAVREGLGLGILPTFLARQDVTAGLLVRVLPSWSFKVGSLFFVHPHAEHVPRKVAAFRDFLVAYLAANPLVASSDSARNR